MYTYKTYRTVYVTLPPIKSQPWADSLWGGVLRTLFCMSCMCTCFRPTCIVFCFVLLVGVVVLSPPPVFILLLHRCAHLVPIIKSPHLFQISHQPFPFK